MPSSLRVPQGPSRHTASGPRAALAGPRLCAYTSIVDASAVAGVRKQGALVRVSAARDFDASDIAALRALVRDADSQVVVRVDVPDSPRPPTRALRRAIREDLLDPRTVLALAFVHAGPSIRAKMIRGVLAGICKATPGIVARVFDRGDAAETWLHAQLALPRSG